MGIQGLLPLLKSIQLPISMAELSGNTVGVDVYCWLHKGAYACALHLAEGKDTDVYVNFVMKRVNMMLYHKVKPILVFDGGYLPSKKEKETERRNKRQDNRSRGMSFLQSGDRTRALDCFQKSIDITPDMAYKTIKACREKGIDCIVAPYEADAQLAYLMKIGITQFTISEDSDLLVYGCEKVVFKMDANGSGLLVNLKNLPKLSALRMDGFTEEKFRQMCILSGCDYLQSVKGMGLITSHRLIQKHSTVNKAIGTLRLNNKMKVPQDYEIRFAKAEQTFLYQIVFDPNTGRLVPLNPVSEDINTNELHFAGHNGKWKQEEAVQLALGNINPITGQRMGNIKVDKIISFDKQEERSCEKQRKKTTTTTSTTPLFAEKKGPRSLLSSNGKYEAQKNLNGSFRETKSSEKTKSPFVTPTRTKRSRSASEENLSAAEGSKLAKLYLALENDEATAASSHVGLEAERPDDERSGMTLLKKKFKNPFRCPVKVVNKEQIVSRYFGLAAMDSVNQQHTPVPSKNTSGPNENDSTSPQTTSSSPRTEDLFTSSEHTEIEFQDSGYCSQTNADSSPPESSSNQAVHKTTPVLAEMKLAHHRLRTSSSVTDRENREPSKKKQKSSQISLDRFTFVKSSAANSEISPFSKPRTVLGSTFSKNSSDEVSAGVNNAKREDFENENFTMSLETKLVGGGAKIASSDVFGKDKWKDNIAQKTKTIGLHSKPSTGLGRCRSLGLHRPKLADKKKKITPMAIPLSSYFSYRGRSSQQITST